MAKFNNEWEYLIHLLSAVLEKKKPEELPEDMSFEQVLKLAKHHSVANMAYYGVEKLEARPDGELSKKWAEIRDKEIMKDIIQLTELEQLSAALSSQHIKHITLKGSFLKTLYPQSDFRTMADIDLFINTEDIDKAKEIMRKNGYEPNRLDEGACDEYYKKPVMNIEIHRQLFGDEIYEYEPIFQNIWDKTELINAERYNLTTDYFLAYVIAHGLKHYRLGGTGIRTFMDIYVYRRRCNPDMERIYKLFEAVGQREACEDFVKLSEIWFEGGEYTPKHREMAEYIIRGGTYGTFENQTLHGIKEQGKLKYAISKLFPSFRYMCEQFPKLKKAPFLLPFYWVVRVVRGFTVNRRQNMEKLKTLKK